MAGSTDELKRSGWRARADANLSGAIFGVITATAVIAATSSHDEPLLGVLLATLATLVIFWLAHVYAEVVAHHLRGQHRPSMSIVRAAMVKQLPVMESSGLSILLLILGVLGIIADNVAVTLALWAGPAQLVAWGLAYARQQGWSWAAAGIVGVINGAFGAVIIVLKALIH